uniref:Putative tail protein n=1 Tax=viral metagenome TaxID=1070528 RepID=A0A6M3L0I6_9ZZZZ
MAETLTELVAKISVDATNLKSGLRAADGSIGSFVSKNAAGLRSLGVAFTAMGGAIVGGLAASTKAAVTFESAFAGVRKTVDATEGEFAVLRQGIRDLAKELPLTHSEIAGIAEAAGQLGIEKESILGFAKVMAQLGMTTNMASDEAATALARFANITQMSQDSFGKLGAVIVDLGNNFATTEGEIVEMAMRLAGAANTVGMTEAQIMGMAAALSSVGIKAELGGTAFAKVMLEMNSAVASGGDKLKAWADVAGVSADKFKEKFKTDAAGSVMDLIASVGRLQESGADVTGVLEGMGLGGIRLTDALLRAAGAGDLFTEAQILANKAWEENTALTEEAGKRLETTASRMGILKNTMVDLGITIGEFIVPILKVLVEKIMPIVESIQAWIKEYPALARFTFIVVGIIGGLLLVLGPLLIMLPSLISLIGILTTVLPFLGVAFAVLLGPVGLIILGITALIAIGILVVKNWDWIKDKAVAVWGDIKRFFQSLNPWNWIKEGWDNFTKGISGVLKNIFGGSIVEDWTAGLKGFLGSQDLSSQGKSMFDSFGEGAIESMVETMDTTKGFISDLQAIIEGKAMYATAAEGRPSLTEYIGSQAGRAELAGRMAEGGISKREAISDMQEEVYGFGLPGYAKGGIVPGPIGAPQLATVHGGETIIPANESIGGVTVNFTQPVFFDREDTLNKFVDMIRKGIQRQDRLRFGGAYNG